jgi:hypothetical protein
MIAHGETGESALIFKGRNMKKLIATIFFTVLAVGSIYGCLIDDGYRGNGMRGDRMERRSEGQRDQTEREDHRDRDEQRKGNRY